MMYIASLNAPILAQLEKLKSEHDQAIRENDVYKAGRFEPGDFLSSNQTLQSMITYPIDPRTLNPGESFIGDSGLFLTVLRSRQIGLAGAAIGCTELLVRQHGREAGGLFYATYLHGERVRVAFGGGK